MRGFPHASSNTLLQEDDFVLEEELQVTLKTKFPEESANPRSPPVSPGYFLETNRSIGIGKATGSTGADIVIDVDSPKRIETLVLFIVEFEFKPKNYDM